VTKAYSLQDLELLLQMAERGSMSEVGRQLNMTTAGVSAGIKRLEAALGVTLFERTTRSLHVSAAGEAFIPQLQKVLGALDLAENELHNRRTLVAGEIRVGPLSDLGVITTGLVG
jgi:DNA-binding transcriptional LysR family regulator